MFVHTNVRGDEMSQQQSQTVLCLLSAVSLFRCILRISDNVPYNVFIVLCLSDKEVLIVIASLS